MKHTKFNHQFVIAFELVSAKHDGSDVTADMIREAIKKRLADLPDDELVDEAVGPPNDTYCMECDTFGQDCRGKEIEE